MIFLGLLSQQSNKWGLLIHILMHCLTIQLLHVIVWEQITPCNEMFSMKINFNI